ncbi:MAG: caspase family protein [Pseudomonadota bacterium]
MSIGLDEIIKIAKSIGKRSDFYGPDTALLILEAADDLDAFTQRYHEYMTEDQKQLLGYVDKPKDHGIDRILENWPAPPEKEKFWDQGTINKMAGRRRALLLGCAEYAHFSILSSTLNDISAMNNVLADKKIGCFASIDQIENTKEYSAHEILSIIIDWMNNSSRDDTLLLYFSGHAFALNSNSGLYLATEQTLRNDPETAINFQNVLDAFAHCKAPSLLAILDCCQSGAASSQVSRTLVPRTKSGDTPYNEHFGYGGLRVMTSSTMGQPSFEGAPGALSPFTEVLVRGLQEGIADTDRDGIISDVELFSFVERTRQAGNIEGLKTPTHNVLDGRTPYLVALNRFAVEDVHETMNDTGAH